MKRRPNPVPHRASGLVVGLAVALLGASCLSACSAPCREVGWRCLDDCGVTDDEPLTVAKPSRLPEVRDGDVPSGVSLVGAAPGNERGPGGFVPRREARSFYSAGGGRLWYYLNHYYWVPATLPTKDLWIRAEVIEEFRNLKRWPDATPVKGPAPKVTHEYWAVGASGRTITIDNHKDYWLLSDGYCAGEIHVTVTLELGRLSVKGAKGGWGRPSSSYVLEHRTYGDGRGIGVDAARFDSSIDQPVTEWAYRVPWSSCPGRFTRSNWGELSVPEWVLVARRAPSEAVVPSRPAVTTDDR